MSNVKSECDIIGVKLPNGKVQVIKSNYGSVGEIFENVESFKTKFQAINEGSTIKHTPTITILESVLG